MAIEILLSTTWLMAVFAAFEDLPITPPDSDFIGIPCCISLDRLILLKNNKNNNYKHI